MARPSSLEPRFLKSREAWVVNVPPELSDTGKRRQLFFRTKKAASADVEILKARADNFGVSLAQLTPARIAEAAEAYKLLTPRNISLLDAVTRFLAELDRRTASKTFGACFDAYANARVRSPDYAAELRHTRAIVESLLERPIVDIIAPDLESCLEGFAPSTRDARIRRLRSVFAYAIRKGWTTTNIADQLDIVGTRHDEVQIYRPEEVERMLQAAFEHDKELVPFLALCAFCGLRPEREAFHLDWSDVHLDDKNPQIVIRPELSKVKRRRFVDVSQNVIAWIRASGTKLKGRVCPFSFTTLVRKRRDNRAKAKVGLIPDGLRHSYCSAALAKHGDVNKLLLQTGHTSTSMLFRHYHRVMTPAEAEKFWNIRPATVADNIVPMAKAS